MTKKRVWSGREYYNLAKKQNACEEALIMMRRYLRRYPNATAVQLIKHLHSTSMGFYGQEAWPLHHMVEGGDQLFKRIRNKTRRDFFEPGRDWVEVAELTRYFVHLRAEAIKSLCILFGQVLPCELED